MKEVLIEMIEIFKPKGEDWMGYRLTKKNTYTYHHCIKKCNGGAETVDNGAILTKKAHDLLNIIESIDIKLFNEINNTFKKIAKQRHAPTELQRIFINECLIEFEQKNNEYIKKFSKHYRSLNSRNKTLTKKLLKQQYNNKLPMDYKIIF